MFEAATCVYGIVVLFTFDLMFSKSTVEFYFLSMGVSCISGMITWIMANGKHWLLFSLIYELVLLAATSLLCLFETIFTDNSTITIDEFFSGVYIIAITALIPTIIPTLLLSFFGYHLPKKMGK